MPLITISHQIGSGGREIGQKVATKLGVNYIDREIVQGVAQRLGITETDASDLDERADHLIDQIFSSLQYDMVGAMAQYSEEKLVDRQTYLKATHAVLDSVAETGNAVIAGHGANFYLAGRANFLSVFIYAPHNIRIERLMKRENLTEVLAHKLLHTSDSERSHYIKSIYKADWRDPYNYHLEINTSFATYDLAADLISKAGEYCSKKAGVTAEG
jgi:cytidylate kinase